jgi:hypothetical protein
MKEIILTKPRARHTIYFRPDKDDDWFIFIYHTDKNGKSRKRMIIQKDMDMFLNDYINDGWIISSGEETIKNPAKSNKKK